MMLYIFLLIFITYIGYYLKMTRTKKTKSDKPVSERLRMDILSGEYRAGEWLKQADIEEKYNANRFEVRIALSDLSARKIIDHISNRGYRVINPTDREREELYEVRTVLETAAAKMAVQRATESDIAELSLIVEEFYHAIENQGRENLINYNVKFHEKFYALSQNKLLARQIIEMRERGLPGRSGGWDTVAGIRASNDDHAEMVEMLKKKDPDGMAYIIYRHLNRWREFTSPAEK